MREIIEPSPHMRVSIIQIVRSLGRVPRRAPLRCARACGARKRDLFVCYGTAEARALIRTNDSGTIVNLWDSRQIGIPRFARDKN
jgi:hypothetical protein